MAEISRLMVANGGRAYLEELDELPTRLTREWEIKDAEFEKRKARRRKSAQLRKNQMDTFWLSLATAVVVALFVVYMFMQFTTMSKMHRIDKLEDEVTELKSENDEELSRIEAGTADLATVRERAINDLGMVYADEDSICYYDMTHEDYIEQYEAVK